VQSVTDAACDHLGLKGWERATTFGLSDLHPEVVPLTESE